MVATESQYGGSARRRAHRSGMDALPRNVALNRFLRQALWQHITGAPEPESRR
jgi:hypothetical protein